MSTHAKHSPSSLPYKALCPGWISDPRPSDDGELGTRAHAAIADWFRRGVMPEDLAMVEYVERAASVVDEIIESLGLHDVVIEAEKWLPCDLPECSGTADIVIAGRDGYTRDVGVVIDWKALYGEQDDADKSLQLKAYAYSLFCDRLPERIFGVMAQLKKQTTICGYTGHMAEIRKEITDVIARAEAATPEDYSPCPRACNYCGRKLGCPALETVACNAIAAVPNEQPALMNGQEVAHKLDRWRDKAKLVEKYMDALTDRAKELLEAGDPVPGYVLKETNGARKWSLDDDSVRSYLADEAPGISPDALATPTEMERRMVAANMNKKQAQEILRGIAAPQKRKTLEAEK